VSPSLAASEEYAMQKETPEKKNPSVFEEDSPFRKRSYPELSPLDPYYNPDYYNPDYYSAPAPWL